jgi:transposase
MPPIPTPPRTAFAPIAERVERRRELAPLLDAFFAWANATVANLSAKATLAEAFRYALNRREALSRFVTDGRLEIDNNIAENAMRGIAIRGSLCTPSSSIWEHWKRVRISNATRATISGGRHFDRLRRQVIGTDLVRRSGNNLLGCKNAGFNKPAYRMVCDA